MRRMFEEQENVFYYLTVMNENYVQPAMPENVSEGIVKGIYKLEHQGNASNKTKVKLLGSGTILEQVREAAKILHDKYSVASEVYSVTSFNELGRDGIDCEHFNLLNPEKEQRVPYITTVLKDGFDGPTIAATDYMKSYVDQVRAFVPGQYKVLGTDGFGRSDSRANLRHHFEVDAKFVVIAALRELVTAGNIDKKVLVDAISEYGIDQNKINPLYA